MGNVSGCKPDIKFGCCGSKRKGLSIPGKIIRRSKGRTGSGSYRLVITVTKDQRTVMEVPYYFIVQSVQSDNLYHTKEARFNVYFECLHWIEASFL